MTHLATTLYLNQLYQQQYPKIVVASDGGFIDNVLTGIKEHVSKIWEDVKGRPFAGIAAFLGPGLLFKLGFPWLAVAYEVAEALGFDWVGFWDSLKNSVFNIVKGTLVPGSSKPSDEEIHQQLTVATEDALRQNTTDKVDEAKLQSVYEKTQGGNKSEGTASTTPHFIKQAGILGRAVRTRGVLSSLFKKIIPWVVTRALIALGFAVAGGAVSGAAGITHKPKDDSDDASENNGDETGSKAGPTSKVRDPIYSLKLSPSADPDLFEFNKNDANSVWLENGSINDIKNTLIGWILSAFPDQAGEKDKIMNSPSFIEVENMFRNRNKLAQGLQIYSVPKPFQRKIDIVSYILNGYLKTK